jgi:hypothetical protein
VLDLPARADDRLPVATQQVIGPKQLAGLGSQTLGLAQVVRREKQHRQVGRAAKLLHSGSADFTHGGVRIFERGQCRSAAQTG